MATPLPISFTASPLPSTFRGTPQQFLDALVARLAIESPEAFSLFTTGAVAPSSDQGPFLKNGVTWYVWNPSSGSYVPETLEYQSLKYAVSQTAPDHTIYAFWIATNTLGNAVGVYTYNGTEWRDVYKDKLDVLTVASNGYPASAKLTGSQTLNVDGNLTKVLFDQELLDPDSVYDSANSKYVAPVAGVYRASVNIQVDNNTGTAASMEFGVKIVANGSLSDPLAPSSGVAVASPPGGRWFPQVTGLLNLSAGDIVEVYLYAEDGVDTGNVTLSANSQFCVELVKAY